jgi:hypothetical protein
LTVTRLRQIAWLHGDHRSTGSANCRNGRFRFLDEQTTANDQSALSREG